MKFQLFSDVHLEFGAPMPLPGGEVLLIAGDIMLGNPDRWTEVFEDFIKNECSKYQKVFYIMGNHEYYHGVWEDVIPDLRKKVEGTNITILDKEFVKLEENITIWGGTMWTSFFNENMFAMMAAGRGMNDYQLILQHAPSTYGSDGLRVIRPDFILEENRNTMKMLQFAIEENKGRKLLIMTHHGPSRLSVHPRFDKDDILNAAYVNEYDQYILDHPEIKVWVHGHTHDSHDYKIGETQVLCNPRGYMRKGGVPENSKFNPNLEFEV